MGKRSEFEKIPKDQYMTIDPRVIKPLDDVIYASDIIRFAEPCVGNGDLIRGLESTGNYVCLWATDKYVPYGPEGFTLDAMDITSEDLQDIDMIITNPPWSREILHPMIEHFANLKPTWLLFDADWMHTRQSSELIRKYCTDIVSVGRLIWIPGTKVQGKDNCAWYKFDNRKTAMTFFHGR